MNLNLLEKLNDKQKEAASQIDGSILILNILSNFFL